MDRNGLTRGLGRSDHRLRGEIERDAKDIGVLDVEQTALLVQVVRLAPERTADDLLAEKLRPKGADAEHMSDSACIPAFAEHRGGNDAPDLLPETGLDTNGIDHFSKEVFVGELIRLPAVPGTLDSLTTEKLDLVGRRGSKVPVERVAGVQLLALSK